MDTQYLPAIPAGEVRAPSTDMCQSFCRGRDDCSMFTYWANSEKCLLAGASASPSTQGAVGAVAGFAECQDARLHLQEVCANTVPQNGFPGLTAKSSNAAWTSGRQPKKLECWPMDGVGNYKPCHTVKTLEDTFLGWPGKCKGLFKQEGITGVKDCSDSCEKSPTCPGWQVGDHDWCYHGLGHDCFVRPDFSPVAAQRLQHGQIRPLFDLTGWQVVGLTRQFVDTAEYFQDHQDAIAACKKMCYSEIQCQYWQYSPKFGCWIEDPWRPFAPPSPLTLDWAFRSTPFALDCIAGEMIMHFCPAGETEATTEVTCARRDIVYRPAATGWSDQRMVTTTVDCQKMCASNPQCAHFSYFRKGMCRLVDASAAASPVGEHAVASGPPSCLTTTTLPPTTTAQVSQSTSLLVQGPPAQDGETLEYMLQMNFLIRNLDYTLLSNSYRRHFRRKYAEVIAKHLDIDLVKVMETPTGAFGRVELTAKEPHSMQITACVLNEPALNRDLSAYEEVAQSKPMRHALGEVTRKSVTYGNAACVGQMLAESMPSAVLTRTVKAPEPTGWTRWWPFVLLLLLVCLAVAVISGALDMSGKGRGGALSGQDTDGSYSDGEFDPRSLNLGGAAPGGARGPLRFAQDHMRALSTAVKDRVPHRRGEFTV